MATRHCPAYPYHVAWISTNLCNARCRHCSSSSADKKPNELTTAEVKGLFDDLAGCGVLDLTISGGEPLLRADIFELLDYAVSLGLRTGLGSNGTTITPKIVALLKSIGLHRLQISIDGLEKTHDALRSYPGLYKIAQDSIRTAVRGGLRVNVCLTLHKLNKDEVTGVLERSIQLGVKRFNISRFVPIGRGDVLMDMTNSQWESAVALCKGLRDRYEGVIEVTSHLAQAVIGEPALVDNDYFSGCQAGRGQGAIGAGGEVYPCIVLPLEIGNIRDRPFSEIWHGSSVVSALRERSGLKGDCHTCRYVDKCGGCRAVTYAYTGDVMQADPRCWL